MKSQLSAMAESFNEAGSQTDTTNQINASPQTYYTFDKYHFS